MQNDPTTYENSIVKNFTSILPHLIKSLDLLGREHDWHDDPYWYEDVINGFWNTFVARSLSKDKRLFPLFIPINSLNDFELLSQYDLFIYAKERFDSDTADSNQEIYFVYSFEISPIEPGMINAKIILGHGHHLKSVPVSHLDFILRDSPALLSGESGIKL